VKRYEIVPSTQFKKDLKRAKRRGCSIDLLTEVIRILAAGEALDPKYHDHELEGNYAKCRECHIQPDWLLIYRHYEEELVLYLLRTGSHSDLF